MQAAGVTTLATLASVILLATSRQRLPSARGDEPPTGPQLTFVCTSGIRQLRVAANSSWQAVTMQAQNQNFTGDCSLYINVSTHVDGNPSVVTPSQPQQQQVSLLQLLLKIDQVKLATATNGTCDDAINSLNVFTRNRSWSTGYICNLSSVYIWTNESIELYMYAKTSSSGAPSFSVAFIVAAELINVCRGASGSAELQIDRELYVFAPDSRYSEMSPNNVICSNANYTLTLLANSSSGGLSLAVLASPPNSSCCSLLIDGQRCRDGCNQSFGPRNRFPLLYSCDGCDDGSSPGFTLRVAVVSATTTQTSTTSEEPTATRTSISSTHRDTFTRDTATPSNTATLSPSTRTLNITTPSVSGSSSLSSTLLSKLTTDDTPDSSTNCTPELIGISSCSPSRSPNSSPGVSGNEMNDAVSKVSLVIAAVVGSAVGVAIVVTVSTVVAKRRCRLKCAKAGALQESGNFRQSGTVALSQLSPTLISSSIAYERALENSAADIHMAMVDNDLYVAK